MLAGSFNCLIERRYFGACGLYARKRGHTRHWKVGTKVSSGLAYAHQIAMIGPDFRAAFEKEF
jgi:hypothetical protein